MPRGNGAGADFLDDTLRGNLWDVAVEMLVTRHPPRRWSCKCFCVNGFFGLLQNRAFSAKQGFLRDVQACFIALKPEQPPHGPQTTHTLPRRTLPRNPAR